MSARRSVTALERRRRDLGLRQRDLAQRAGVSRSTVSLAECGYVPGAKVQARLAEELGVEVERIWTGSETRRAQADADGETPADHEQGGRG